jgi:hypothetical protein
LRCPYPAVYDIVKAAIHGMMVVKIGLTLFFAAFAAIIIIFKKHPGHGHIRR